MGVEIRGSGLGELRIWEKIQLVSLGGGDPCAADGDVVAAFDGLREHGGVACGQDVSYLRS